MENVQKRTPRWNLSWMFPFRRIPDVRKGGHVPVGDVFFNAMMVLFQNSTPSNGWSMPPSSETRRKMAFKRVKESLFPYEKQKGKACSERGPRRGLPSTTVIDVDVAMPPPPKERRTRHNKDRVV